MEKLDSLLKSFLRKKISRRTFVKLSVLGTVSLFFMDLLSRSGLAQFWAKKSNGRPKNNIKGKHELVVVQGEDPYIITRRAIESMGGMDRFVKKGSVVVIKPNIAWDRTPEYAANTNPFVVAALVEMCYEAGAKRVNVFDIPCNSAQRCYENSGIKKAAEEKGAKVYFCDSWNFVKAQFPYESQMEGWPIFRDAIECDTFINVPILKHHGSTQLTLSMKNLMGVCGGARGLIHVNIGKKLVDITGFINPDLTVIDAYRVLIRHGPSGGSLFDVVMKKTVIVGTDPVLTDIYSCKLVDVDPNTVAYIAEAIDRGLGSLDTSKADIFKLSL
jgi:uncharacterized protein (DUF362 family)